MTPQEVVDSVLGHEPEPIRTSAGPGLDDEPPGREPGEDDADEPDPRETVLSRIRSAAEVMADRPPRWIVDRLLAEGGISVLAGESTAGKSYVVLSLLGAVAQGARWMGRRTRRGSVVLLAYEGDAIGLRLRALADQIGDLDDVYILRGGLPLSPVRGRDGAELPSPGELHLVDELARLATDLARRGRPPIVALALDTASASISGTDSADEVVRALLRAVRRILRGLPGAGVIVVHHAGWQDGEQARRRERGSSVWRADVDGSVYLEVEDDSDPAAVRLVLRAVKVRDAERPAPLRLIRRRVDLGILDDEGEPMTSCVIEADPRTARDREAEAQAAREAAEADLDDALLRAIVAHPTITSVDGLRELLGRRRDDVTAARARLYASGRLLPPQSQRGGQYRVVPSRPESSPGPDGTSPRESSPPSPPTGDGTTRGRSPRTRAGESSPRTDSPGGER